MRIARGEARAAPHARSVLTWVLVATVGVSGLAGIEAWPLTGWRLFSHRRHPVVVRFEARALAADGSEAPVPFDALPLAYSGSVHVLARMAGQRPEQREPACRAWADATTRVTSRAIVEVRVYEVAEDIRNGRSRERAAWTCGRGPG